VPELPEVETIRRQLAPLVVGRTLEHVAIDDPRWTRPLTPAAVEDALTGRTVERLSRRGKYLVWELSDEVFLIQHLRMTGTVLHDAPADTRHVHVRMALSDGHTLSISDPRRFGTGDLALGEEARDAYFAPRLGIEPLDGGLDGPALRAIVRDRRPPIKAVLLDQRQIAGVGNIYADEALFRAGIHPLRPARQLTGAQCDALAAGVVAALTAGLDAGGATIDDFRHVDGVYGGFQHEFLVHRREGEPCPTCGRTIVKFVAAGRGTYACETCQVKPRLRAR
jgi:formamidopyrimidine-DNA glycosylase